MIDDRDRLLNLFGLAVTLFVVVGLVGVVVAGLGGPSTDVADAPTANWSLERVNDSHVRLTHRGGEAVPADRLVVTADGVRRRASWSGLLSDGDSGAVYAEQGVRVQLYWTTDTGARVKLQSWDAA